MSNTAIAWLLLYVGLAGLTFRRSSYGFALYLTTFYAPPTLWWWGAGFLTSVGERWALAAALIFLLGVLFDGRKRQSAAPPVASWVLVLLGGYVVNACMVHFLFAVSPEESLEFFIRICKYSLLSVLIYYSIKDVGDLKIILSAIVIGGIYIGYEVYFNEAGRMRQGRLEGIPLGSASDANYLSSILSLSMILAGFLVFVERGWRRYLSLAGIPFLLETIQQSLSRGTMLALIGAAISLLVFATKKARSQTILALVLALGLALLIMGPQDRNQFIERFTSIFVEDEERDASAGSRLELWGRCLNLIGDHPLGLGGESAFKSEYASKYVADLELEGKAVHNGYLDIAASWGIQGLLIALLLLLLCVQQVVRDILVLPADATNERFLGAIWVACGVLLAIAAVFLSSLRGEWFYWWGAVALALRQGMWNQVAADDVDPNDSAGMLETA